MSLLDMESWMLYQRYTGSDDSASASNNAMRAAIATALRATGMEIYQSSVDFGWVVRQHPVYPDRNGIAFSASAANNGGNSIIRKRVAVGKSGTLLGGFSIFVPSSFLADPVTNPQYGYLNVFYGTAASNISKLVGGPQLCPDELFRVRYDLKIGYGTEVQSSKTITPGKQSYLEYRLTGTEFRVWLDDTLVLQKTISHSIETIAMGSLAWGGTAGYSPNAGPAARWAIADWYNLLEDAVEPNVRLGPSTRVVGVRPASDVAVQFARPSGYVSNAAVVALPFDPSASLFLKTDTVGAKDTYNAADDTATATASLVHGQMVKVLGQNVDSAAHTLTPLIVSGDAEAGTPVAMPSSVGMMSYISTVDPATGQKWTPGAAAIAKIGMKIQS